MPFPITSQVIQVSGTYAQPYLVHNAGSAIAYLGTSSSLSVGTQALTLVPGASLNWNGSDSLYAVCAPGESTVIETLLTGNGHSAPGPSSVSLSEPVAIDPNANAVSIPTGVAITGPVSLEAGSSVNISGAVDINGPVALAAGTAVDISGTVNVNPVEISGGTVAVTSGSIDATISGPVTIESGTIDATINGLVNVNQTAAFLWSNNITPGAGSSIIFDSAGLGIDITPFASLHFTLDTLSAFGSPAATPSALSVNQYVGAILIRSYAYNFLGSGGIDIMFDNIATRITVGLTSNVGAATVYAANLAGMRVKQHPVTSMYPMPGGAWYFQNYNQIDLFDGPGIKGVAGTTGTASQSIIYPPHTTGDNLIGILQGTISTIFTYAGKAGSGRMASYNGTLSTQAPQQFSLAPWPIVIETQANYAAGQNLYFTIEQQRYNNQI